MLTKKFAEHNETKDEEAKLDEGEENGEEEEEDGEDFVDHDEEVFRRDISALGAPVVV